MKNIAIFRHIFQANVLLRRSKILLFLVIFGVNVAHASGGHGSEHIVTAPINYKDKVSLQKGAKIFMNNCSGCHSAKYIRYERISQDLGIPIEIVEKNLMFTTTKIGDPILTALPARQAKEWFGIVPPDLTLEARLRGADWLYSYLIGFYPDEKRPWGANNHVFDKVGMPDVLAPLKKELGDKQFESAMADLTNFMVYIAEPMRAERETIGAWVLIFLAIFFIPVYFLNREYWKDVK